MKGDFDYVYDPIGNRTQSNVDGASPAMTYTTNAVNQYTATSDPAESFTYDEDGNLKADGTFTYTWDAGTLDATANAKRWSLWLAVPPPVVSRENRLIEVVPVSPSNDQPRNKKVKFVYDYMGP